MKVFAEHTAVVSFSHMSCMHLLITDFYCMKNYNDKIFQVEPNNKLNSCRICKKTFYSKAKLVQHQSNVQCGQKPYSCPFCEKSYSEISILSIHHSIVHGPNQKLNNCQYTKHSQSTVSKLRNRNHNGKSLKHKKSLKTHQQNNLLNCIVCNIVFSSKNDLSYHRKHSLIHKVNLLVKRLKKVKSIEH